MRLALAHWIAPLSLALAGCSAGQAQNAAAIRSEGRSAPAPTELHAVSGLPVIPLTVIHSGKKTVFRVEVASSMIAQGRGLMFRTGMAPDEGMIFPMDPPRLASFWMRNTVIPLDIIYIGTDNRVLNVAANAVPYDETPLVSQGMVKGVLELNAGRAAQLGIGPGALVQW
jgi:uncharacterized protein